MQDSLGKNATQLLRHCVRLLVIVSTDLLAVRSSGMGVPLFYYGVVESLTVSFCTNYFLFSCCPISSRFL